MIASEYGWTEAAILKLPLARAFCYQAAILQRRDVDTSEPSFAERDLIAEMKF